MGVPPMCSNRPHATSMRSLSPSLLLPFVCLCLFAAPSARALSVIPPTFAELVAESESIVRGEVTAVRSAHDDDSPGRPIRTYVTFDVVRTLKGVTPAAGTLTLVFLGGTVGTDTLSISGMPAFSLGDREILFVARNGKTIEVLNTDAEGRLILADALALAAEGKPGHMVNLATLTGACLVALGTQIAGLMGNNLEWSDRVRGAIARAGERAWALPMDTDFEELLQSKVADLKNSPQTRYGGAIAAGKFLEQFVAGIPWVHLDIAGPAWADHDSPARDAGGTGAFVHSLIELAVSYRAS